MLQSPNYGVHQWLINSNRTKKVKYLEDNLGALNVRLSPEENAEIRRAVDAAEVHGERYEARMTSSLLADTPPLKT
jgi:hypothetical protein